MYFFHDLLAVCRELSLEDSLDELMQELGADSQGRISYEQFLNRRLALRPEIDALKVTNKDTVSDNSQGKLDSWEWDSGARDMSPVPKNIIKKFNTERIMDEEYFKPRQMPPQRFPTNSQVFGPPRNVFKPSEIPTNQLSKPEPMSTTSINPSFRTNRTIFNNRKPPNFTFEELYNKEIDETEVEFTSNYEKPSFNNFDSYYNTSENIIPENANEENFTESVNYPKASLENLTT
ncbi:unnamed protein product [Ceutorhynchus assimilis]|uniref:EF-hand domain-containing protein n=1 Tax=Ceutorhynchus assimilis TaxID=467358 RepID=A0A9N9MQK1_9CUCU|nr:unnamed protein product [Ceutorhynchus assimilis]